MSKSTLQRYVKIMREAGGGTPNFQASASASGNPESLIPNKANNAKETMEEEANKFLAEARQRLYERQHEVAMQSVPGFDATPYLQNQLQSTGWTGGTNFSNASSQFQVQQPSSTAYYGGAMPFQQVPPMPDTLFPALQNYPFNQSAPLNSSTNFVPSQNETDSLDWSGGNSQNNEGTLESMIRTGKPGSSKNASQGFDSTPFLPNQSQSTGLTGTSNFFSPTPNTYNFNSGNPGSAAYYGGEIPFQQAPMPGTSSFPAFPNPFNQSAPLNSSTNFVPFQPGTYSTNFFGENSQNNEGTLESMIRKPSSSEAFSNHPFNQSAPLNPSTNFGQSQNETDSLDWSGGNSQNDDLYSVEPRQQKIEVLFNLLVKLHSGMIRGSAEEGVT
uniref:Uncharacterized protein n=1 Tax=Globodera rostochiensis TaxID=31243 RepID=A0A914GT16_GLORO